MSEPTTDLVVQTDDPNYLVYFQVWKTGCPKCQIETAHRVLGWSPHPLVKLGVIQCMTCRTRRRLQA